MCETQSHAYYQIAISPSSAATDLDRGKRLDRLWPFGAEVAVRQGAGIWVI